MPQKAGGSERSGVAKQILFKILPKTKPKAYLKRT
jgi:hypothetical protein